MVVDDWFVPFLTEHLARHPHVGLPTVASTEGESLYAAWRSVFIKRGIHDHPVATEASELLTAETLGGPREHFPRLVALALDVYKARQQAAGPDTGKSPREAAAAASKGCEHCGGSGMVSVYHPRPDPVNRVPASVGAHCVCPHGRWIRNRIGQQEPTLLKRIPDLADALSGRCVWLADDPMLTCDAPEGRS